jgi:hypothetical protein
MNASLSRWPLLVTPAVIPQRTNRSSPRDCDRQLYGARHLIENFFAKIKQFRAIATREAISHRGKANRGKDCLAVASPGTQGLSAVTGFLNENQSPGAQAFHRSETGLAFSKPASH